MVDAQNYFEKWKDRMENFIFLASKLAKPIVKHLTTSSQLVEPLRTSSQAESVTAEDVERLRERILRIRAALADADRLESKSESLKLLQRELRDVEYEAEDILELFELEAHRITSLLQLKSELSPRAGVGKRKREVWLLRSHPSFDDLQRKIKLIRERYNDIVLDREALRMPEEYGEKLRSYHEGRQSSSLINTRSCFTGRDTELKELIDRVVLVQDAAPVITIVGMTGMGKTALAQQVFNSSPVMSLFGERRWWVTMSSAGSNSVSITRSIIDAVTLGQALEARNCTQLDTLQRVLTMELKKRGKNGFLLVLDDARTEMQDLWDTLCRPFNYLSGGRLLVTTRSLEIARKFSATFEPLHLHPLIDSDCLSIVFCRLEETCDHQESIAKILPRCGGLPLAAKILGSLISGHDCVGSEALWDDLVNKILPILRSSYNDLSLRSKRCFEYLSLFPRGHTLDKEQLARLWMAQELEQSDSKCFYELVGKLMLAYDSDKGKCWVHHLFHELARSVSDGECTMAEKFMPVNTCTTLRKTRRHLSLVLQNDTEGSMEQEIQLGFADGGRDELTRLRTLLFIKRHEDHELPIGHAQFIRFFPYLRTLDLSHTSIEEVPIPIGNLRHLRYLGLRSTRIQGLPESICLLYKLQTLDLKACFNFKELPRGMTFLSDLQHLELPSLPHILMPRGIGGLTKLQTLSTFVLGNRDELCHIGELKDLIDLRELYIFGLNHVSCEREAEKANLQNKEHIEKLTLNWSHDDFVSSGDGAETVMNVLKKLQPHTTLKSLVIIGYYGKKFSPWLGDEIFTRLVSITLEKCPQCTQLPPLGQLPFLKHLSVAQMKRIRCVDCKFCGSHGISNRGFPKLETMEFQGMPLWELWCGVGDGDFASLKSISLTECPKLNNLPVFKSSTKWFINYCPQFSNC